MNLRTAGGLLRYRAARDGRLVHEASVGLFDRYRLEAARFWCDNAPVIEPATTRSWSRCRDERPR